MVLKQFALGSTGLDKPGDLKTVMIVRSHLTMTSHAPNQHEHIVRTNSSFSIYCNLLRSIQFDIWWTLVLDCGMDTNIQYADCLLDLPVDVNIP